MSDKTTAPPTCPCFERAPQGRTPRDAKGMPCGKPALPVDGRDMRCRNGHVFAGTPDEHARALDEELDRLAAVNNIPRDELADGVFAMKARLWQELGKVPNEAALIDALKLGVAADLARREGDDAQDEGRAAVMADVDAAQVSLPRRGLRRAVGRIMGLVSR